MLLRLLIFMLVRLMSTLKQAKTALLTALERIWSDMAYRKMYITGGVGPIHDGLSKRHDQVHEAFDFEYHLHNAKSYNETCANIGNCDVELAHAPANGRGENTAMLWNRCYTIADCPVSAPMANYSVTPTLCAGTVNSKKCCAMIRLSVGLSIHVIVAHRKSPERLLVFRNGLTAPPMMPYGFIFMGAIN